MYIDPDWTILTIGDGDLSFSLSLSADYGVTKLSASCLDEKTALFNKYSRNGVEALEMRDVPVFYGLDINQIATFPRTLFNAFDVVIFQFPLVPNGQHQLMSSDGFKLDTNLANRLTLFNFLRYSQQIFLSPQGAGLVYLTSKDVKPYLDWNIPNLSERLTGLEYLGTSEFDKEQFPHYRVRNVDRDKIVKTTLAKTYTWKLSTSRFIPPNVRDEVPLQNGCVMCQKGPFMTIQDKHLHDLNKRHMRLLGYEKRWQRFLDHIEKQER